MCGPSLHSKIAPEMRVPLLAPARTQTCLRQGLGRGGQGRGHLFVPTRLGHRAVGTRTFAKAGVARPIKEDSLTLGREVAPGSSVGCVGGARKPRPLTGRVRREGPVPCGMAEGLRPPREGVCFGHRAPTPQACGGTAVAGPTHLSQKGSQRLVRALGRAPEPLCGGRFLPRWAACLAGSSPAYSWLPPWAWAQAAEGQASRRMEPKASWTNWSCLRPTGTGFPQDSRAGSLLPAGHRARGGGAGGRLVQGQDQDTPGTRDICGEGLLAVSSPLRLPSPQVR